MLFLAMRNLARRPARTALTAAGVVCAVFLATTMYSLVEGMDRGVAEAIGEGGVDMFITEEGYPAYLQDYSQIRGAREAASIISAMPGVEAASPYLVDTIFVLPERNLGADRSHAACAATGLGYVPALNGGLRNMVVVDGGGMPTANDTFYEDDSVSKDHHSPSYTGEALVNGALAELMGLGVGDRFYLFSDLDEFLDSPELPTGSWPLFTVNGMVREPFQTGTSLAAVVHLSELQYIVSGAASDPCSKLFVSLSDWDAASAVKAAVENATFPYSQRLAATTTDEFHAQLGGITDVFEGFSKTILVITFVVAVAFVSTVMMVSARERVKELGVLKAMGVSNRSIAAGIAAEAMVLASVGMVIGIALGWAASSTLDGMIGERAVDLPRNIHLVYFTWGVALRSALTALAMGAVSALAPAAWAMRLRAVENIRDG